VGIIEDGYLVRVWGTQTDITDRKLAEQKLQKILEELERSNKELERFAYIASHDLQEPLRKIQAFGDRLNTKYETKLDNQGQDYLTRMLNATKRMQTLINDLLTYSRVTTQAKPFDKVDLSETLKEVIDDFQFRIKETKGRLEIGELPTIEADPTQMRQLLQNLIDNCLKFHKQEEPPTVKVHGKIVGKNYKLFVEDNGIGFDEKHRERIFTIFQRLHGRLEYEGTGIGLAVCRKIMERHGGEITAKSKPGHGSTFIITLPLKHNGKLDTKE
jgi:light-regulated signal transduction histidine kinase (bacteriophytochrome)